MKQSTTFLTLSVVGFVVGLGMLLFGLTEHGVTDRSDMFKACGALFFLGVGGGCLGLYFYHKHMEEKMSNIKDAYTGYYNMTYDSAMNPSKPYGMMKYYTDKDGKKYYMMDGKKYYMEMYGGKNYDMANMGMDYATMNDSNMDSMYDTYDTYDTYGMNYDMYNNEYMKQYM